MIPFLRAFVLLRWRLLVNALQGGRRRDAMDDLARATALAIPIIFFAFFAAGAVSLGWLSFLGGRLIGSGGAPAATALFPLRILLLLLLVALTIVPIIRSTHGSTLGVTRLLLLPIPRRALHLVEVASGLFEPWVLAILPVLVILPIGMAAAGRGMATALSLVAGTAFVLVCASLGALVSFVAVWLLRDRRRGEVFTLIFVLILMVGGLTPALYDVLFEEGRQAGAPERKPVTVADIDAALPGWTIAIPSELYAHAVDASLDGSEVKALLLIGLLFGEGALLFVLSYTMHARLLDGLESGSGQSRRMRQDVRVFSIPPLPPQAWAVASSQVRASLRTLVGRLSVLGTTPIVLLIGLVLTRLSLRAGEPASIHQGHLMAAGGMFFALLTLQPILMNQFASDRTGIAMQLLAPISDGEIVMGKAVGGFVLFAASSAPVVFASFLLDPGGPLERWLTVLLGGAATYLWTAPIGAILSATFPKASNLGSLGTSGKAHGAVQLLGSLFTFLAVGPPVLVYLLASGSGWSAWRLPSFMLGWLLLAVVASVPLFGLATRVFQARRENVALVALGR